MGVCMLKFTFEWGGKIAEVELPVRVTVGGVLVEAHGEVRLSPAAEEECCPGFRPEGHEEDPPEEWVEATPPEHPAGPPQPAVPLRGGEVAAALPAEVLSEARAAATVRDMLAPLLAAGLSSTDILALVESEHRGIRALARVPL